MRRRSACCWERRKRQLLRERQTYLFDEMRSLDMGVEKKKLAEGISSLICVGSKALCGVM